MEFLLFVVKTINEVIFYLTKFLLKDVLLLLLVAQS